MAKLYPGHYLMGCRFDNWLRLLGENRGALAPDKLPEALLITAASAALYPPALLEGALFNRRIRQTPLSADPVFILGFWRSGTTYLQNMLSRDPQFAWADPASVNLMPVSLLLGRAMQGTLARSLRNARPMDNLEYRVDLPIEETFAMLGVTTNNLLHLLAFPANYARYVERMFPEDLPPEARAAWIRDYDFLLRKLSFAKGGRQLLLKSPDNTARLPELMGMYPDARYVHIHRDPLVTVRSAIHMLQKQMDLLALTARPANFQELMEDIFLDIFERMYRQIFALQPFLAPNRWADVAYADFVAAPVETLRAVYERLELSGFEAARPRFETYAAEKKDYVKNQFEFSPRLREKVTARLPFVYERYGYAMED